MRLRSRAALATFLVLVGVAGCALVASLEDYGRAPDLGDASEASAFGDGGSDGRVFEAGADGVATDALCAADLMTSATNCGACGHDCLDASCESGMCAPASLATGLAFPFALALNTTSLCWVERGSSPVPPPTPDGVVGCVGKNGTLRVDVGTAQNDPLGVDLDTKKVYWTENSAGNINVAPIVGGSSPIALYSGQPSAFAIAVDNVNVYWSSYATLGQVSFGPKSDGGLVTVAHNGDAYPLSVAVQGPQLFWVDDADSGSAYAYDLDGGTTTLLGGANDSKSIAVDPGTAYWTNSTNGAGAIYKATLNGATLPAIAVTSDPLCVAVDATHLYWTDGASQSVYRSNKDGSGPIVLAAGVNSVWQVQVDDAYVYWIAIGTRNPATSWFDKSDGAIYRVAK